MALFREARFRTAMNVWQAFVAASLPQYIFRAVVPGTPLSDATAVICRLRGCGTAQLAVISHQKRSHGTQSRNGRQAGAKCFQSHPRNSCFEARKQAHRLYRFRYPQPLQTGLQFKLLRCCTCNPFIQSVLVARVTAQTLLVEFRIF